MKYKGSLIAAIALCALCSGAAGSVMDPAAGDGTPSAALGTPIADTSGSAPAPARFRTLPLPVASLAAVPEPAGLVLLGLAALLLIRRRRSL